MGFGRVFLFIFVFALLEAMVLGQVAQTIGWPVTILLTVLTAMMGSLLFRWQGVETWIRLNHRMQQGEMPGVELVEGVMLLLGGALLITPGFITDAVGFTLLLPQSRKLLASFIVKKGMMQAFSGGSAQGNVWVYQRGWPGQNGSAQSRSQRAGQKPEQQGPVVYEDRQGHFIIEGQAEQKDDKS